MFEKARLKLTGWYLLIIMLISVIFSLMIYAVINQEYSRIELMQRLRQERGQIARPIPQAPFALDPEVVREARVRLQAILILINLGILITSGFAGYFLAGRTLRPIKEMLDEQNRFITDASHELRTPLTSLKSGTEVNLRDKNLSLKNAKKLLQSNLEEVNNLQTLSDGLIKLTQYQENNRHILEKVSLTEILNEAQKKVINLAKHKNIIIKNQVKDYTLEGDKQSLTEVFVILLDNAIKYSSPGKKVTLTSQKTDGMAEVRVTDQGIGIDEKDLPYLFDRFYRADKSRTKVRVEGFGLGLAIAKQTVEKHGGSIKVESEIGKGSTFQLFLRIVG